MVLLKLRPLPNSQPYKEKIVDINEEVKVGRASIDNPSRVDNLLFKSQVLSRQHAVIWLNKEDSKVYLKDSNSSNGTYVNGNAISRTSTCNNYPVELKSGDVIQFGADVFIESTGVYHKAIVALATILSNGNESYENNNDNYIEKQSNLLPNSQNIPYHLGHHRIISDKHLPNQILDNSVSSQQAIDIMDNISQESNLTTPLDECTPQFIEISTPKYAQIHQIMIELINRVKSNSEKINEFEMVFKKISDLFDDFAQNYYDSSLMATRIRSLEYQLEVYSKLLNNSNSFDENLIKKEKRREALETKQKMEITKDLSNESMKDNLFPIINDMESFLDNFDSTFQSLSDKDVVDMNELQLTNHQQKLLNENLSKNSEQLQDTPIEMCYQKLCELSDIATMLKNSLDDDSYELQFKHNIATNKTPITNQIVMEYADIVYKKLQQKLLNKSSMVSFSSITHSHSDSSISLSNSQKNNNNICDSYDNLTDINVNIKPNSPTGRLINIFMAKIKKIGNFFTSNSNVFVKVSYIATTTVILAVGICCYSKFYPNFTFVSIFILFLISNPISIVISISLYSEKTFHTNSYYTIS